jgi:hypothetical protein
MQKAHNTDERVIGEVEIQCLIFVYFVNDTTHIPISLEQWQGSLELEKKLLGLNRHKYQKYSAEVFVEAP